MKFETLNQSHEQHRTEAAKKVYQSPQLVLYGNISEITRTVDNAGNADGPSGGSMDKT